MNLDTVGNLPEAFPANGSLYISTPFARVETAIREFLSGARMPFEEPYTRVFAVELAAASLATLSATLGNSLTDIELRDTKCCVFADGDYPSLSNLMQTESLRTLVDRVQGQWLVDVLREERLITHFQPIVVANQTDQVFAYECLVRALMADGQLVMPNRLFSVARANRLLPTLDRAARRAAIAAVARLDLRTRVFINLNPRSFDDPQDFLEATIQAANEAGISTDSFVFEVVESEESLDSERLLSILGCMREAGFKVALDDLGAGYSSLNLLTRLKPDFIKLDVGLMRHVDRDPYKGTVAAKLLELARHLGVRTVVEGIETAGEWRWAKSHGADFVQGFFIAAPDLEPPRPAALPTVNGWWRAANL